MIEKLKSKLRHSPEWMISICVFIVYWFINKSFTGPAILWDEIGYLTNAALISGHVIDGANSWHAGYSFFLAPLFAIFSEPSHIWQAAMVLNALIWAVSFLLLARILKILQPERNKWQLFVALLIAAAYPTWITMSGYVFATTAFVFVYLLAILALLFWKPNKFWTIIPHGLAVGYLYWIHPVGLAVCMASFLVIGFVSAKEKRYASALVNIIVIIILITAYREIVDKWLLLLATPEGYDPFFRHYPGSERLIAKLFNYDFWLHAVAKSLGQASYLIVSSFGLILFGFIASIDKLFQLIQRSNKHEGTGYNFACQSAFPLLALSLLGILAMGAIFFSGSPSRVDQWIYGRYTEMVVLPLLALGYLSFWRRKWLLMAAMFVFITGLILNKIADMAASNFFVHTVAFWPQHLIWENNFLYWMAAASLVLILLSRIWNASRFGNILVMIFVMLCFVISALSSAFYHHNTLAYYKPSTLVNIIRENYSPGSCIGHNQEASDSLNDLQKHRYNLHLFHLYDYNYRRMSPEEWLENCDGPYFTYNLDGLYEKQGVKLIGQEVISKLYLLAKKDRPDIAIPEMSASDRDIYRASGWSINYKLQYEGIQLADMLGRVGNYKDGSIFSTGDEGFLLVDSGKRLGSGKYNFVLQGEASVSEGSWVDIVSQGGRTEHAKYDINNDPDETDNAVIAAGTFLLEEPVHNLEVRVCASSADNIRIDGYEIEYTGEFEE